MRVFFLFPNEGEPALNQAKHFTDNNFRINLSLFSGGVSRSLPRGRRSYYSAGFFSGQITKGEDPLAKSFVTVCLELLLLLLRATFLINNYGACLPAWFEFVVTVCSWSCCWCYRAHWKPRQVKTKTLKRGFMAIVALSIGKVVGNYTWRIFIRKDVWFVVQFVSHLNNWLVDRFDFL